jgi:hypothetical protein
MPQCSIFLDQPEDEVSEKLRKQIVDNGGCASTLVELQQMYRYLQHSKYRSSLAKLIQ